MVNYSNKYLQQVAEYVTTYLKSNLGKGFYFHNLKHTENVVKTVAQIGRLESLSNDELEIVSIAAWFHDTGVCLKYSGHEDISKQNAQKFLSTIAYDKDKLKRVLSCIDATKIPQDPIDELGKDIDAFISKSGE